MSRLAAAQREFSAPPVPPATTWLAPKRDPEEAWSVSVGAGGLRRWVQVVTSVNSIG